MNDNSDLYFVRIERGSIEQCREAIVAIAMHADYLYIGGALSDYLDGKSNENTVHWVCERARKADIVELLSDGEIALYPSEIATPNYGATELFI